MKKLLFLILLIAAARSGDAQTVVAAEWYIDTDAGFGLNTSISLTPGADIVIPFTTALAGVKPGPHILYMRTRDNNGAWSHTTWRNINVLRSAASTVLGMEYFFGADPGFGRAAWIPFGAPAFDGSFPVELPPAQVSAGPARMYLRTMSSDSSWSHTTWKDMTILIGVGVSRIGAQDFSLYPNPSAGELHLEFGAAPSGPVSLTVTNAAGAILQRQTISAGSALIRADYPSGRYFLTLSSGGETVTRAFQISR